MTKTFILTGLLCLTAAFPCLAQDTGLAEMAGEVIALRKATKEARNQAVVSLSAASKPKITLMDEVRKHDNEYKGKNANQFKMNQVVTYVYGRQNQTMASKGDYFNSNEKDIHYSAIEKSVKKGASVTYTITGHSGDQQFIIIPFSPKTVFNATVNGTKAEPWRDGAKSVTLKGVRKDDTLSITIDYSASNKAAYESFVILNHNPQE